MDKIIIRRGEEKDTADLLNLIRELATYEQAADEVESTIEELRRWGFGPAPVYGFFVAEKDHTIVGIALYYYKYSTWKGRCLFLEDLIVTENERGKGIGKMLFEEVIRVAKQEKVKRLEWQVLEWNAPAITFYKKFDSVLDPEWINCKLTDDQLALL